MSSHGYMATATSDDWPTPQWLVDAMAAEFGPFDLDPAASPGNAKAPVFFTKDDDGLAQPWKGKVWLNPPYGRQIVRWLAKARGEVAAGRAEIVVCLVPVRTGTRWWAEAVRDAALVLFWPARVKFGSTDGVHGAPGFDSAVLVYGTLPRRHGTAPAWCPVCKRVFWPARSDFLACSRRCRRVLARDQVTGHTRSRKGRSR